TWDALDALSRAALVDALGSVPLGASVLVLATLDTADGAAIDPQLWSAFAPPTAFVRRVRQPAVPGHPGVGDASFLSPLQPGTGGTRMAGSHAKLFRELPTPPDFGLDRTLSPIPGGAPSKAGAGGACALLTEVVQALSQAPASDGPSGEMRVPITHAARHAVTVDVPLPDSTQRRAYWTAALATAIPTVSDFQGQRETGASTVLDCRAARTAARRAAKRGRGGEQLRELPPPPPPPPAKLSAADRKKLEAREDKRLRQLRLLLREVLGEFGRDSKLRCLSRPVDPELVPDYYEIIEHPMDLSTMRSKVDEGAYLCYADFAGDLDLILSNAKQYNSPRVARGRAIIQAAHSLRDVADTMAHAFDRRVGGKLLKRCSEIAERRRQEESTREPSPPARVTRAALLEQGRADLADVLTSSTVGQDACGLEALRVQLLRAAEPAVRAMKQLAVAVGVGLSPILMLWQ
ncbi:ATAD2, partial [Symbiodinium sp. KB8]